MCIHYAFYSFLLLKNKKSRSYFALIYAFHILIAIKKPIVSSLNMLCYLSDAL